MAVFCNMLQSNAQYGADSYCCIPTSNKFAGGIKHKSFFFTDIKPRLLNFTICITKS